MSDTFTFDGIVSSTYGVLVYPTDSMISAPARLYTRHTVPGRSGDLLVDEHRFENTVREYGIIIAAYANAQIAALRNALASRVGYFRLTDTFDPTHYYMAMYSEDFQPTLYWRTKDQGKATISFERKPQRFLLTGEQQRTYTGSGSITNPTMFPAKPLLRVYGTGTLGIGSTNITIADHGNDYIDIDCETGRAYYNATALDNKVTLNAIDYPSLLPGSNGVNLSGVTRAIITPRWWEI